MANNASRKKRVAADSNSKTNIIAQEVGRKRSIPLRLFPETSALTASIAV